MAERIFLGLGSNLGDRRAYLERALSRLARTPEVQVVARASLYQTEPLGFTAQPRFLNTVVELSSRLGPRALLQRCQEIEARLGRVRGRHWGPRRIDLDLLFYGMQIITEADLQLPHPRLTQRRFVLVPLAELAPQFRHPATRRTIQELLETLADDKGVMSYREGDSDLRPLSDKAGGDPRRQSVIRDLL